jgi:drug efflux transport system permease protein
MSPSRLWAVAQKEVLQLRRDARSLMLAFLLPVILILFFGYAISFDVTNIALGVLDQSHTPESRRLVDAFTSSGYFTVTERLGRAAQADPVLQAGRAQLILVIPPDFKKRLDAAEPAPVQLLLDGGDANTATIAQNYADAIVAGYSSQVVLAGRRVTPPLVAEPRVWFNEALESRNTIVPGLIAVIMSIIAAMLTALTIAREWERGTMEQLAATPVHRLEVVLGKLVPYVGIGLFDVTLAVVAGIGIFHVPLRGNLVLLACLTFLFLLGALGLGMFVSATVKSQVLATQAAIVATYLPALLLSGFIFAIATMPLPLRLITYVVPARYYVTVTKGIFLKGIGLAVLWPDAVAMILFATAGLALAIRAFHKEIA